MEEVKGGSKQRGAEVRPKNTTGRDSQNDRSLASTDLTGGSGRSKYFYLDDAPDYLEFVRTLLAKPPEKVVAEFDRLGDPNPGLKFTRAVKRFAHEKNRYENIWSAEPTRVKLNTISKKGYIHANYIDGFTDRRQYILTQGPMKTTVGDFWEMVWQEKTHLILMLCRTEEGGQEKSVQYWPTDPQQPLVVDGQLKVNFLASETASFGRRIEVLERTELLLSFKGEQRRVLHLQYPGWPDRGTPSNPSSIVELCREVQSFRNYLRDKAPNAESRKEVLTAPIVVHCSAGVGRSGTFVAVDIARQSLKRRGKVDVLPLVARLRQQRWGAVQSPLQYCYIHVSILHFLRTYKLGKEINVEKIYQQYREHC